MKTTATILLEAFIVGILLAGLYFVLSKYVKPLQAVVLSGVMFHLACEYTGVNAWYARTY